MLLAFPEIESKLHFLHHSSCVFLLVLFSFLVLYELIGRLKMYQLNPNWHEIRKHEKCSSLAPPRSKFYKTQWAWHGVKLTRLMLIFTSKKVWKFLIQIQLTKSNPKITRGVKVPCLMPIRVNDGMIAYGTNIRLRWKKETVS